MKKTMLMIVLLMVAHVGAFAQLKVLSSGETVVGSQFSSSITKFGFQSGLTGAAGDNMNNIGIFGNVNNSNNTGYSFGVYGICNGPNCHGYGVYGGLNGCTNGAGVLGGTGYMFCYGVTGMYAGYFLGNTYVTGTLTANTVVQSSDYRLKENIVPLSEQRGNILDKVLNMNVVEYNYRKMIPSIEIPDTVSMDEALKNAGIDTDKRHIGLIAQELKELFPQLVVEGQDGYLAINYVELVPVLIQAIQELQEEVDELKGTSTPRKSPQATSISNTVASGNVLYQNTPNPFKEQTTIRFRLADNAQNAAICIYDLQGKQLKKWAVTSGEDSVSFNGYELGEGLYFYSLIVNGQEIDTKKMIISK